MMRRLFVFVAAVALLREAPAQASFECYALGPLPLNGAGSCEGVNSNGLGGVFPPTGVSAVVSCGFPTHGAHYAVLSANGPVPVPAGGPFPWPAQPQAASEIRIPIPGGSTTISLDWEYFNAETFGSIFNDGMAIAVVSASGALLQQLAYADNQVALGICQEPATLAVEVLPAGPQAVSASLPALTGCEYVSVVCWNGGDNSVDSIGYVDHVQFNGAGAGCNVPCFPGPAAMAWLSPLGPGSIMANIGGGPPSGTFFVAVTLSAGNYPNGWLYGVDIGFQELMLEVNLGMPFTGPLDGCGAIGLGPFTGLPSGMQVFAVTFLIPGPALGPWSAVTPATNYTVP
jgi:hypothetical protein